MRRELDLSREHMITLRRNAIEASRVSRALRRYLLDKLATLDS